MTAPLALDRLPPLLTLRLTALAAEPVRLPPLPTTALHGALGDLDELDALRPARDAEPGEGVTDRPPPPLAIAAERHERAAPSLELGAGETVSFRITLVGARAIDGCERVVQRVETALRRGLGISPRDRERRPPMTVVERAVVQPTAPRGLDHACALRFATPVRLTDGGSIARRIDASLLWRTLLRRADTLARAYGEGPLGDLAASTPPFEVADQRLEEVLVRRYSTRQGAEMTWPGQLGSLLLRGDLTTALPALTFGAAVQIGKATSFGLGLYWLLPPNAHPTWTAARRTVA